jgi:ribosome biogenesis protein ERB1
LIDIDGLIDTSAVVNITFLSFRMGKAKAKIEIISRQEEDDVDIEEVYVDSEEDNDGDDGDDDSDDDDETENDEEDDENPSEGLIDDDEDDGFELQSSSDEGSDKDSDGSDILVDEEEDDNDGEDNRIISEVEKKANRKAWSDSHHGGSNPNPQALLEAQKFMHYDDLSSDDEDAGDNPNTIGRVPLHWYDAFDHVGYDVGGSKVVKRKGTDRIDQLLAHRDDPEARRTIYDMYNDRDIVLTEREMEIIRRVQAGAFAHPEFDDTPDYVDYYSSVKELMPLSAAPEPKRRFVPSKWEMMKVMKIVKAIKEGRYKEGDKSGDAKDKKKPPVYLIWNDEEDDVIAESKRHQFHLPAPKLPLPGHAESYNPPREYLLTDKEKEDLNELDPKDRPYNFEPKAHDCLRHVAGYENFLKERFERCLDLYLCPRKLKRRLNIDPETLVPRLPSPNELKPFPNTLCLQYLGHEGPVRSVSISPDGEYLASGGDDGIVRLWEIDTCLCRYVWDLKNQLKLKSDLGVSQVSWNPDSVHAVLIAVVGKAVVFIATGTGDIDSMELTDTYLSTIQSLATTSVVEVGGDGGAVSEKKKGDDVNDDDEDDDVADDDDDEDDNDNGKKRAKKSMSRGKRIQGKWLSVPSRSKVFKCGSEIGPRVVLQTDHQVTLVAWHYKGDYLSVLATNAGAQAVSIYQVHGLIDGSIDE